MLIAASSAAARAADDTPAIVISQLPAACDDARQNPSAGVLRASDIGSGARIVVIDPSQPPRVLSYGFYSACDPHVSFDGQQVLFAGKRAAQDHWNIFEIGVDGSGLRQITRATSDCRHPGYQSDFYRISDANEAWPQITFVGTQTGQVNESGAAPLTNLYSCKPDGTDVRCLTHNLSSDFDPHITWDGRLVYASWQRRTLDYGLSGRVVLLSVNADGTDGAPLCVDPGRRVKHMPCSTSAGLVVFVEADRVEWDGAGLLSCVDLRRPLHTYRSLTSPDDGLFHSPAPLPDGTLLVSRRPADGSGTHDVYRFDPHTKRCDLWYGSAEYHDVQAMLIAPRAQPDGRSSPSLDEDPRGALYCLNVYQNDLPQPDGMPPGTVKSVRLLEGMPRRSEDTAEADAARPTLAARRLLAEVPLSPDGSFHVSVPANTPIELQLIDADGVSLRSCGWRWTPNHFHQGCIGCHEDPELTPDNAMVQALENPAQLAAPPAAERASIDFRRDLMPTIVQKCVPCHGPGGSPPDLSGGRQSPAAAADPLWARAVYDKLLEADSNASPPGAEARFKYVDPGRARTSPLAWHLVGRNLARPWDGDAANRQAKPIPPDPTVPLTAEERLDFVQWIDWGAPWAAAPAEGMRAPGP